MIKLFKFLKPYKISIASALVLIFLQTLADLYLPTLMSDIVDKGIMKGDITYIMQIGWFMIAIAIVGAVCSIAATYLSSKTAVGLGKILRNEIFNQVESFSLHEFDKLGTSTLITRTTNDINQVQQVTILILRMMVSAPLMAVGGIIMAFSEDRSLTLVLAVAIPVLAGAIGLIALKGLPLFKVIQKKIDKINLVLRENLTGIRVIRAFNRITNEKQKFENANIDLTNNYIKVNIVMAFLMPTVMLIMNFTVIAIMWFGGIRIDNGNMQLGSLIAFTQYAMQIMFSMVMVSMMFVMVPRASAAAERITEVLEISPEIMNLNKSTDFHQKKGFVEFSDVTFSYHGAEQPAVKNISLSVEPGEVTAVIGSTGSGKTTLVNLIMRFYDVDRGSVLVDGVNVRNMTQEQLRSKIGYVPQKAVLFTGTVKENIKYGKQDSTDEEIIHASKIAQAYEFISNMDGGFEHMITQGGTNVSGGQKQRVSIARALVRKPEIYIFDDSFSALDFKTDAKLRSALKKEINNSTVFLITQRVSTAMDADRIVVMDNGEIMDVGTHKELLSKCEVYREIVSSQLSEEELK